MPPARSSDPVASQIEAIDATLSASGMVRSSRSRAVAGPTRSIRQPDSDARELAVPVPPLKIAANGVHFLAAPAWEKCGWLWHGFSTRKTGLSRAYAADGAEGDLNLGLTDVDDREAVLANRRLLAEAVSGDAATPLVTLKQIHSNLTRGSAAGLGFDAQCPPRGDGLMTAEPGVLIGVQTA